MADYTYGNWNWREEYNMGEYRRYILRYTGPSGVDVTVPYEVTKGQTDPTIYHIGEVGSGLSGSRVITSGSYVNNLVISEGILNMMAYAFEGCQINGTVTIPRSMISVGGDSFKNSTMTGLNLPTETTNDVFYIPSGAFEGCSNLSGTVNIPKQTERISTKAFKGCTEIDEIRFNTPGSIPLDSECFDFTNRSKTTPVKIYSYDNWAQSAFAASGISTANIQFIDMGESPYRYTIIVNIYPENHGTVTFDPQKTEYKPGESVVLTAVPDLGWSFGGWMEGYDEYYDNPHTITVTKNTNLTLNLYESPKYTITLNVNGTGGTVSGGGSYPEGTSIQIEAEPDEGYEFVQWNDGNTEASREIIVTGNATYTATFRELPEYTIVLNPSPAGAGTVTGAGKYRHGTDATLTATPTPGSGYHFYQWSDNDRTNPRTVTVTNDLTLNAVFKKKYTLTLIADPPEASYLLYGAGEQWEGMNVSYGANLKDGWKFKKWEDNVQSNHRMQYMNNDYTHTGYFESPTPPPTGQLPKIIKSEFGRTVFIGKGNMTADIPNPKIGYFYINATTGKAMRYDGSDWKNLGANENITI